MKPIKKGYKLCVRADEHRYVSEFQNCIGKLARLETERCLGERVVKNLTRDLEGPIKPIFAKAYKDDIVMKRGDIDWRQSITGTVFLNWKDMKGTCLITITQKICVTSIAKTKPEVQ